MLYFDNAATSWPKPLSVQKAVSESFLYYGANPGRSGHEMSMKTAKEVFACRKKAADMFGVPVSENVVFTKNCTEALNIVIMSMGMSGGHFIISDLEHNSVLRPLYELKNRVNIDFSVAETFENEPERTVGSFKNLIRSDTKMIIATASSNVFGIKLPIEELAKLAHEHGILMAADLAQTAGTQKIYMDKTDIDFICAPGHKGLLGPMGTGILCVKNPEGIKPLIFGGTGNYSLLPSQPEDLPEMLESGTLNVPGICGLSAGIDRVLMEGEESIAKRETELAKILYRELGSMENIKLFTKMPEEATHSAVISFVMGDLTGEGTAAVLSENGVASRGGFHCSALAHNKMGTENRGTCRLSIGPMTTFDETMRLIKIIRSVSKKY